MKYITALCHRIFRVNQIWFKSLKLFNYLSLTVLYLEKSTYYSYPEYRLMLPYSLSSKMIIFVWVQKFYFSAFFSRFSCLFRKLLWRKRWPTGKTNTTSLLKSNFLLSIIWQTFGWSVPICSEGLTLLTTS